MKKSKKPVEFSKLLDLGKEDVVSLNNNSMNSLKGGTSEICTLNFSCWHGCETQTCEPCVGETFQCTWASTCFEGCEVDH